MISMLIYCCKQNEIELLQKMTKNLVAQIGDERLEIVVAGSDHAGRVSELENVDIAFIDITQGGGLQLARNLRGRFARLEIVIISDRTISPIRYLTPDIRPASLLLKPLKYNEVKAGTEGLFRLLEAQGDKDDDFLMIEDKAEKRRIPYSQILYLEARNKKVYARLQNKEYGMCGALETFDGRLPAMFKRCHRGFIVNVNYINKVWYSKNLIVLKGNVEIPLSRSYKTEIKNVVRGSE